MWLLRDYKSIQSSGSSSWGFFFLLGSQQPLPYYTSLFSRDKKFKKFICSCLMVLKRRIGFLLQVSVCECRKHENAYQSIYRSMLSCGVHVQYAISYRRCPAWWYIKFEGNSNTPIGVAINDGLIEVRSKAKFLTKTLELQSWIRLFRCQTPPE